MSTDDRRQTTDALRSFGRRRGRKLRTTKQNLVDTLLPQLLIALPENDGAIDIASLFAQPKQQYWLEIGFGSGEHLSAQSALYPEFGFIGCEPYVNGFGNFLMEMQARDISNVRLYTDDARDIVARLPDASLDCVCIFFPDPWPKSRHHKRRLIQHSLLVALACVMKQGAQLRIATDHEDYLTWILEHLAVSPHFTWTAKTSADWTTPYAHWVETRYQQKAIAEGRSSTYLRYVRR